MSRGGTIPGSCGKWLYREGPHLPHAGRDSRGRFCMGYRVSFGFTGFGKLLVLLGILALPFVFKRALAFLFFVALYYARVEEEPDEYDAACDPDYLDCAVEEAGDPGRGPSAMEEYRRALGG